MGWEQTEQATPAERDSSPSPAVPAESGMIDSLGIRKDGPHRYRCEVDRRPSLEAVIEHGAQLLAAAGRQHEQTYGSITDDPRDLSSPEAGAPLHVTVTPDGRFAPVADHDHGTLVVYKVATLLEVTEIEVGPDASTGWLITNDRLGRCSLFSMKDILSGVLPHFSDVLQVGGGPFKKVFQTHEIRFWGHFVRMPAAEELREVLRDNCGNLCGRPVEHPMIFQHVIGERHPEQHDTGSGVIGEKLDDLGDPVPVDDAIGIYEQVRAEKPASLRGFDFPFVRI